MFDVAPTELLLVAVIALVVIGPKDLPRAMRFVGNWVGKARGMARHFRSGLDTMMREAELEDLEKSWSAQNEEIMRQYPRSDEPRPLMAPYADIEIGSAKAVEDGAGAPEMPPETHAVPPRGTDLP